MPRPMNAEEVRTFLVEGTRTAKIATVMKDGRPHVVPVWFVLDGEEIVFLTAAKSVKAKNLERDRRIAFTVDDENPPYAFVHIRGCATIIDDDFDELYRLSTAVGARYMGEERAEEFGRRNAVPGEILVRVTPERVIGVTDVAGYS